MKNKITKAILGLMLALIVVMVHAAMQDSKANPQMPATTDHISMGCQVSTDAAGRQSVDCNPMGTAAKNAAEDETN